MSVVRPACDHPNAYTTSAVWTPEGHIAITGWCPDCCRVLKEWG